LRKKKKEIRKKHRRHSPGKEYKKLSIVNNDENQPFSYEKSSLPFSVHKPSNLTASVYDIK
jgi:hypothetical protein